MQRQWGARRDKQWENFDCLKKDVSLGAMQLQRSGSAPWGTCVGLWPSILFGVARFRYCIFLFRYTIHVCSDVEALESYLHILIGMLIVDLVVFLIQVQSSKKTNHGFSKLFNSGNLWQYLGCRGLASSTISLLTNNYSRKSSLIFAANSLSWLPMADLQTPHWAIWVRL